MSRSGYSDDCDYMELYRGTIERATRGRRGQAFFRALVAALDALPGKRLVAGELQSTEGEVCALGALARVKGAALEPDDTFDHEKLGTTFDIAHQLAAEVMYENDEGWRPWDERKHGPETPEQRWTRVRRWAAHQIRVTPDELEPATTPPGPTLEKR